MDEKTITMVALVHKYVWDWNHSEDCILISDNVCSCGLESVKMLTLDFNEQSED